MTRFTLVLTALLVAVLGADAFAAAGGGSSGYGGGGGGGGGGFSGSGSGSGSGSEGGGLIVVLVVIAFAAFVVVGMIGERRRRRRRAARVARTVTASAAAADDDAWFAADAVVAEAGALYRRTQEAWDRRDRDALAELVGADLMVEWRRRLDDFDAKGWHNRIAIVSGPSVQYVGLTNREDDAEDRVVVRIEAQLRDVVETGDGKVITKNDEDDEEVACAEWWTLARAGDRWIVVSIEQDSEGEHHLDAPLVPSPWSDEARLSDETVLERAAADALPAGVAPAEVVDVDLADDARVQALDLSLVDERFAPHVLEAAARRAVAAWAEAVDGDDAALHAVADPEAVRGLLHPGDRSGRTRLVVRGPRLLALRITALDADAAPATIAVEAELEGRRYVENRDTLALVEGDRDDTRRFTERWTLALAGDGATPWRLAGPAAGLSAR